METSTPNTLGAMGYLRFTVPQMKPSQPAIMNDPDRV